MPRTHTLKDTRNIGIMAHIDAGKTTTTERILFYTASTTRSARCTKAPRPWTGWSRSRSAASRSRPPRRPASGTTPRINIIDTPGHVDFTAEVERSLRVLDGAVAVFDAVAGVEPQSETVWRQADRYNVPRIAFVNKMDRIGADFPRCVEMMKTKLNAKPAPIQIPWGTEADSPRRHRPRRHEGDRLQGRTLGLQVRHRRHPRGHSDEADKYREMLIEAIAETDDTLLEKYLHGGKVEAHGDQGRPAARRRSRATCSP